MEVLGFFFGLDKTNAEDNLKDVLATPNTPARTLARVACVNVATVASLASAPAPLPNVLLKAELSPVTTLSWGPVPDAAAYEVLWRPTDAPDWTGSRRFKNVQTVRLPLSKDDYLFAVRSVPASGAQPAGDSIPRILMRCGPDERVAGVGTESAACQQHWCLSCCSPPWRCGDVRRRHKATCPTLP